MKNLNDNDLYQTDFGRIYFNLPHKIVTPETVEDLARTLRIYHFSGTPVTIRNTGHSVNGQTLTSGVQIGLEKLNQVVFDEENLAVRAEAGATWDSVFQKIYFPQYITPVFTSNPGQKIHLGGTAAVGGVGFTSAKYGGLWDHVLEVTLVTMEGEIISCSQRDNFELMKYSLGGFGRIGVIAKLTLKVVPSKKYYFTTIVPNFNLGDHLKDADSFFQAGTLDGILGAQELANNLNAPLPSHYLILISEANDIDEARDKLKGLEKILPLKPMFFLKESGGMEKLDLSVGPSLLPKKDVVYYYPGNNALHNEDLCHPCHDYVLPKSTFTEFYHEAVEQVKIAGLEQYLIHFNAFHSLLDLSLLPIYLGKRLAKETGQFYPLSLDIRSDDDYLLGTAILPSIPTKQVKKCLTLAKTLTDIAYDLGGKTYLYGVHHLSQDQVARHFGRDVIETWQKLKDKLDPKHLLNIDVIEHLDK